MPATPSWPPKSVPRLFIEGPLTKGISVTIEGNQAHYLTKVMRVAVGDAVVLNDDVNGEFAAHVSDLGKRHVELDVIEHIRERDEVPDLWLCAALLKKDRFDIVLEKATELGVSRIVPVVTRRCVADKLNAARARTISIEAAEQCARTALPQIEEVQKLTELLANWPANRTLFFADENGGENIVDMVRMYPGPSAILIGPEGGFDDTEREAIRAHPQSCAISLGPRILRGETAAIAALSIWMAQAGDWLGEEFE